MQAIQTKYLPATHTKPSRIKAFAEAGELIVSYDYNLSDSQRHRKAAEALADKLGWNEAGPLIGGSTKSGYVFVFTNSRI